MIDNILRREHIVTKLTLFDQITLGHFRSGWVTLNFNFEACGRVKVVLVIDPLKRCNKEQHIIGPYRVRTSGASKHLLIISTKMDQRPTRTTNKQTSLLFGQKGLEIYISFPFCLKTFVDN